MFRSIAAFVALTASLVVGPVARAETTPAKTGSDANAKWQAMEINNPHSVDFASRSIVRTSDMNVLETDNPHSVDFAKRKIGNASDTSAAWEAAESGNPHAVRR